MAHKINCVIFVPFSVDITIYPEAFSFGADGICISINASNDDYTASHLTRTFEVEVTLGSYNDSFVGTNSSTMTAEILIIEDGEQN